MLFVGVTQMHSNKRVYLCIAILVTKIFCYRYSTIINNSAKNIFLTNLGDRFRN